MPQLEVVQARLDRAVRQASEAESLKALRGSQFVRTFEAPNPVVQAIPAMGRGRVIAITGQTGHGKTTISTLLEVHICLGQPLAGGDVARGKVLVLCGENPDDYNAHLIATMQDQGLEPADLDDILVVPARFPIDREFANLMRLVAGFGELTAVFVDTSAAFFFGDDDNANVEQYEHASKLRTLTTLPGKPVVFVLCHPIKNPSRDNLVPRGGGSFLNEIDANLTVWKDEAGVVTLHSCGKMRGPNFDPIRFELRGVDLMGYPDAQGRPTKSVAARHIPEVRAEQLDAEAVDDENHLLMAMAKKPEASLADLALACGFTSATGTPQKSRVHRLLTALQPNGLVVKNRRGQWRLTPKGRKAMEQLR